MNHYLDFRLRRCNGDIITISDILDILREAKALFGLDDVDITYCVEPGIYGQIYAYAELHGRNGGHKITISDKAIETYTRGEFETILAHEMSHVYNKDIRFFQTCGVLTSFACAILLTLLLLILVFLINHLLFILIFILLLIIELITVKSIVTKIRRMIEVRCDIESAKLTNKVELSINALNKLESNNSVLLRSRSKFEILRSYFKDKEHPKTEKRIEYLKQLNLIEIPAIDKQRPNLFKMITKGFKCIRGCYIAVNHPPIGDNVDSLDYAIYLFHTFKC
jgi:hypothetical protein